MVGTVVVGTVVVVVKMTPKGREDVFGMAQAPKLLQRIQMSATHPTLAVHLWAA